jgi:hypothetical protein
MRRVASRWVIGAAVVVGVGLLAVAGRLLPAMPSSRPPAGDVVTVIAPPPEPSGPTTLGVLVPQVVEQRVGQARTALEAAGLSSGVYERDPQGRDAVVVAQEPPAGVRVPPGSVVGFRTSTDPPPNDTQRGLPGSPAGR